MSLRGLFFRTLPCTSYFITNSSKLALWSHWRINISYSFSTVVTSLQCGRRFHLFFFWTDQSCLSPHHIYKCLLHEKHHYLFIYKCLLHEKHHSCIPIEIGVKVLSNAYYTYLYKTSITYCSSSDRVHTSKSFSCSTGFLRPCTFKRISSYSFSVSQAASHKFVS